MTALELAFLALFWTWAATAGLFLWNTVLPRAPLFQSPDSLNLPSETVRFRATDGVLLEGWKIPSAPDRPWLILCHGLGSNRADLLEIGAGLSQAGFNLFLFDFRGHGGSRGRITSFGWQEQRDVQGALAFLGQQADAPPRPYGVYGISMGGSVALMVAGKDERIGAVAADSPYPNLGASLSRHVRLLYPWLPRVPFHWFVHTVYRVRFGVWPRRVSPEAGARRLGHRPLLLIHGALDHRVPLEGAERIAAAAGEPASLWVVEGAGHLEGYALNPPVYLSRLIAFFQKL